MTKQDFIALADMIRAANERNKSTGYPPVFSDEAINLIANYCAARNPRFLRGRWLEYIAGKCGPNAGKKGGAS